MYSTILELVGILAIIKVIINIISSVVSKIIKKREAKVNAREQRIQLNSSILITRYKECRGQIDFESVDADIRGEVERRYFAAIKEYEEALRIAEANFEPVEPSDIQISFFDNHIEEDDETRPFFTDPVEVIKDEVVDVETFFPEVEDVKESSLYQFDIEAFWQAQLDGYAASLAHVKAYSADIQLQIDNKVAKWGYSFN